VPLRGDGTIDADERQTLEGIAAWMARNGEAIHGTRPWRRFGEGPTQVKGGSMGEQAAKPFTAEDIRFTRKDDALYAIFLDWPAGEGVVKSLGSNALGSAVIERVDLLGGPQLQFRRDADALRVMLPPASSGTFVPALRIRGRGFV
jgi:alpha-L-fucosidase